ncbi:MAG: hypothetical protein EOP47_13795 [Sphingobacteriaceae bacterium]|nr:MAG: hypothetical protein EOP47_13795 [Sphingobacteriaceae bacterium]
MKNKEKFAKHMSAVFFIIMIVLTQSCTPDVNERKSLVIHGVVISKFRTDNSGCLGSIVIETPHEKDTIPDICICTAPDESIWEYVNPQDSISKKNGSLIWKVFRGNKIRSFKYPSCYK